MKRRRLLRLGATAAVVGAAGCSGDGDEPGAATEPPTETSLSETSVATETSSPEPSTTETSTATPAQETPQAAFEPEWAFDADDWTERRRVTEYPDSDEAVDWTPDYARSAEYSHVPSREELAAEIEASEVPPVICAIASKRALPGEFSSNSVGFVLRVREWFMDQFENFHFDFGSPENVNPGKFELESGQEVGRDLYELEGNTGRLESPFQATIDGESVEVTKVSFDAEGRLLALVGPEKRVGYLAGGAWPAENGVTLHTADNGAIDASATVSGESQRIEDRLAAVLDEVA